MTLAYASDLRDARIALLEAEVRRLREALREAVMEKPDQVLALQSAWSVAPMGARILVTLYWSRHPIDVVTLDAELPHVAVGQSNRKDPEFRQLRTIPQHIFQLRRRLRDVFPDDDVLLGKAGSSTGFAGYRLTEFGRRAVARELDK